MNILKIMFNLLNVKREKAGNNVSSDECHYASAGVLPLPERNGPNGIKLGIAPESFDTLSKIKKQQKIEISTNNNLSSLSNEQLEEISKKVIRDVAAMKLVSGTRGLSGKELEDYYEKVRANKTNLSEQQREYLHKVFSDAFKRALKEL